jgi:putative transposase
MKRGRFSEEQIVGILKEHEAGRKIAEQSREHGIRVLEPGKPKVRFGSRFELDYKPNSIEDFVRDPFQLVMCNRSQRKGPLSAASVQLHWTIRTQATTRQIC